MSEQAVYRITSPTTNTIWHWDSMPFHSEVDVLRGRIESHADAHDVATGPVVGPAQVLHLHRRVKTRSENCFAHLLVHMLIVFLFSSRKLLSRGCYPDIPARNLLTRRRAMPSRIGVLLVAMGITTFEQTRGQCALGSSVSVKILAENAC